MNKMYLLGRKVTFSKNFSSDSGMKWFKPPWEDYNIDRNLWEDLISLKQTAGCLLCREKHPNCLDFHHVKSHEKSFSIMTEEGLKNSLDEIIREISKCVVLCRNCHMKLHANERERQHNFSYIKPNCIYSREQPDSQTIFVKEKGLKKI